LLILKPVIAPSLTCDCPLTLNQNADIILNEVGTTNRSVLNGALEVFGQDAAVVGFAILIKSTPFAVVSIKVVGLLVVSTT
jgi:hypothetical protein